MNTFLLVVLLMVSPTERMKIEVEYDTRRDCEITSAILEIMPNIYSVDCETITPGSTRIGYNTEQGV